MSTIHKLKSGWIISYQGYGPWKLIDAFIIYSVEDFWKIYDEHLPKLSLAFRTSDDYHRNNFKHGVERIRSWTFRRETIEKLEWEDTNNKGYYICDMENLSSENIQYIWETLLLLTIGESLGDTVRAVRVLDRGKKQSISTRYEIWCSDMSELCETMLAKDLSQCSFAWKNFE